MNIFPKNVFRGQNSDGSTFTMAEWDFSTLAQLQGLSFLITLIVSFLAAAVASPILLLVCLFTLNGQLRMINIVGILISAYFLIDAYNSWLGMSILGLFCDKAGITFMVALNVASLITHIAFFVLNGVTHRWLTSDENKRLERIPVYLFTVAMIFGVSFIFIGKSSAPTIAKERFELIKTWEEKDTKVTGVPNETKEDNWHN